MMKLIVIVDVFSLQVPAKMRHNLIIKIEIRMAESDEHTLYRLTGD